MDPNLKPSVFLNPRPTIRSRTNLSTFQVTDEQKEVIDQAFAVFQDSGNDNLNKGDFLQMLALQYLKGR